MSYQDLLVWQKAMDLATDCYKITKSFPKEELYGLVSQIRRCAVSILSNIAEGQGRNSKNEFVHFLGVAQGSLRELETQIILSQRIEYVTNEEKEKILALSTEVGIFLSKLKISLKT
jgi:four helix bundle protein